MASTEKALKPAPSPPPPPPPPPPHSSQQKQQISAKRSTRSWKERELHCVMEQMQKQWQERRAKSLLSLCVARLGCHLHEIICDIHLIAPILPPSVKIQLIAIARRRGLLCDKLLVPLADEAWEILDVSGSDVTDEGILRVAPMCPLLKAVDVSCCSRLTADSIRAFVEYCPALETLRCGGTRMSNIAARLALPCILPGLNVRNEVEENWEDLEAEAVGTGLQSLRWIVWPSIDEQSKETVEVQCPRVVVNPVATKWGMVCTPTEALPETVLDQVLVADIDPSAWAVRSSQAVAAAASAVGDGGFGDLSIAERFRLAFVARDERLAPKRAKNLRQNQRRVEKSWLSSNVEAKARHLAATVELKR